MRAPRRLAPDEAELWHRVAKTVTPMAGQRLPPSPSGERPGAGPVRPRSVPLETTAPTPTPPLRGRGSEPRPLDRHGLDASWERKLARGIVSPDFTLDLHGHTLDSAHARLEHGLSQALAHGARVVLLVTGRARPAESHAARGERRGAIRAKFLDWLAHGPHASRIASVRGAHPRHGGAGAVYIVLKRPR